MSEWTTSKLSDVIEIIGGGTPKRSETSYWNGNIPWLSVGDFNNDFRFVSNTSEKISKLGLQNSSTKLLKAGQLILSARGTVGCLAQLSIPMAFNQSCYGLNGKENIIDNGFLYYFLKNNINELKQKTHGSVFDTITRNTFEQINISYPNIKTQQVIARTLGFFDNKITLNTQTNQTLEQIAQAIFKHWFIDFAPVHTKANALARGETIEQAELAAMACLSGKTIAEITALQHTAPEAYHQLQQTAQAFPSEFVESEMGLVPKGWEVKKIKNIGKVICGKTPSKAKEEFYGDDIPFIKIPDMHNNIFITNTSDKLSLLGAESQKNKFIEKGSICISCIATVGIVSIASRSSQTNQQINSIIPNSEILTEFLYLYFSQENTKSYLKILASGGSTTLNLNTTAFSNIKLLVPDEYLLAQFHRKTSSTFNKILLNYKENNSLQKIRDELLPKLLNGEIEL